MEAGEEISDTRSAGQRVDWEAEAPNIASCGDGLALEGAQVSGVAEAVKDNRLRRLEDSFCFGASPWLAWTVAVMELGS